MNFVKYETETAYNNAELPQTHSRVALIEETDSVKIDGVNVRVDTPVVGDVVFLDEDNNITYIKGGNQLVKSLIPANWTHVGYVYLRKGNKVGIINKDTTDAKYADVVQFKVNIPNASGTMSLGARYVSAGTTTTISVEYTLGMNLATETNTYEENTTTLCGLINTALSLLNGITGTWWAYLNDDNQVILQRDTWTDYRQYNCSGALTHITWGDMPEATAYWKTNGKSTTYVGAMNISKFTSYYSTNGRTPTTQQYPNVSGDITPVKREAFYNSEYCEALRNAYDTYEDYIIGEYKVAYPLKYSTFALPNAKILSTTYASKMAPTKDGRTKAKFPAFNACYNILYDANGIGLHDWYLPSSLEGCYLMNDNTLATLATSISKMGTATITSSVYRWFAERYGVNTARFFNGTGGTLNNGNVSTGFRVLGVTLLDL